MDFQFNICYTLFYIDHVCCWYSQHCHRQSKDSTLSLDVILRELGNHNWKGYWPKLDPIHCLSAKSNLLSPFHYTFLFLYPLKTLENLWFFMFLWGTERDQWHENGLKPTIQLLLGIDWKLSKSNNTYCIFFFTIYLFFNRLKIIAAFVVLRSDMKQATSHQLSSVFYQLFNNFWHNLQNLIC